MLLVSNGIVLDGFRFFKNDRYPSRATEECHRGGRERRSWTIIVGGSVFCLLQHIKIGATSSDTDLIGGERTVLAEIFSATEGSIRRTSESPPRPPWNEGIWSLHPVRFEAGVSVFWVFRSTKCT